MIIEGSKIPRMDKLVIVKGLGIVFNGQVLCCWMAKLDEVHNLLLDHKSSFNNDACTNVVMPF